MPSPNVGIGAALVITVPDPCVGMRATAVVAGVEFRGWFGVTGVCLGQENAVRVEALIADAAAAKTLIIAVVSITAVSGIEFRLMKAAATFEGGFVDEEFGNVDVFDRGLCAADRNLGIRGWDWKTLSDSDSIDIHYDLMLEKLRKI